MTARELLQILSKPENEKYLDLNIIFVDGGIGYKTNDYEINTVCVEKIIDNADEEDFDENLVLSERPLREKSGGKMFSFIRTHLGGMTAEQ